MDTSWHEARSIPVPETGCWLWLGADKGNGYGHAAVRGRNIPAHRHAFELIHGPQAKGIDVCHKCDTRRCINPDHLFAGSRTENMQDAKRKNRLSVGAKHGAKISGENGPGAKLTLAQVVEIRSSDATNIALADSFKVSKDTISKIKTGRTWKERNK